MEIKELYEQELITWKDKNLELFGVSCINEEDSFASLQKQLDKDCKNNWNSNNKCKLAQALENKLDAHAKYRVDNTWKLKLNPYNMCIDILQKYVYKDNLMECKVAAIPTPTNNLSWLINRAQYVPRVTAVRCQSFIKRYEDYIRGEYWNYNLHTKQFEYKGREDKYFEPTVENILERLSYRSRVFIEASYGKEVTKDNFIDAITNIPFISDNSIFCYEFSRYEHFEQLIFNGVKAKPCTGAILGINIMFISREGRQATTTSEGCLVLVDSQLEALENFRTVVNIYNSTYKPEFSYTDTLGFFDCFKTVTSTEAGRQRLLLDNVTVKNGMLYIEDNPMFMYLDNKQEERLSCLSQAPFGNNDKPKRIMMNAKLTAQAIPILSEYDDFTHRTLARVGFADIEGYSLDDSLVISESFAKRLKGFNSKILYLDIDSYEYKLIQNSGKYLTTETAIKIFKKTNKLIVENWQEIKVDKIEKIDKHLVRVFISWSIPFSIGDKITNLHGAKGTVGLILPDDEMPRLLNKVGNLEPGALDVIVSGFSTMKRGSLGQIFEAWMLASNIDIPKEKQFIKYAIDNYKEQMKVYAENSIVEYKGKKITMPIGYNNFMRLYHHASIHASEAPVGNMKKALRLGEMEKLNLYAHETYNILEELSIRSGHKYFSSNLLVNQLMSSEKLPDRDCLRYSFNTFELLKVLGYELYLNDKNLSKNEMLLPVDNFEFIEEL